MRVCLRNSLRNPCLCSVQLVVALPQAERKTEGLLSEKAKQTVCALYTTDSTDMGSPSENKEDK